MLPRFDLPVAVRRRIHDVAQWLKGTVVERPVDAITAQVRLGVALPDQLNGADARHRRQSGWNGWREPVDGRDLIWRRNFALACAANALNNVAVRFSVLGRRIQIFRPVAVSDKDRLLAPNGPVDAISGRGALPR